MEREKGLGVLSRVLDEREEFVVDRDRNVCGPILSIGNVSVSKEWLWQCNLQGNDVLSFCKSFSYYFAIEQTLLFPEFVEWCASSYSPSERVIMIHTTSKIICKIDAKSIRGILNLPDSFPDNCEFVNEPILAKMYKSCKTKIRCGFLSSIHKEGQSLEGLFLSYKVHIFKEEVQLVMSLVYQILGLDDDIHIREAVLGFLLRMSSTSPESHSVHYFSLDEYLVDVIHI